MDDPKPWTWEWAKFELLFWLLMTWHAAIAVLSWRPRRFSSTLASAKNMQRPLGERIWKGRSAV